MLTQIVLLRVLGTSPAYRRQVQTLDTCYLLLDTFFNVECRTPDDEGRSGDSSYNQNGTSEGTLYMVHGT